MIKRKIILVFTFVLLFITRNVQASGFYYSNGDINLTEREYNYVIQFYGENFLENMSIDDYNWISELDLDHNDYEINKNVVVDKKVINPKSTFISTNEKSVAISKACATNYCSITILTTWLAQPNVKSYDVIGARLYNTSLYSSSITTYVRSSSGTAIQSNYMNYTNGFGNSILLPSNENINNVEQRFRVNKSGTVYGSYQHAMSNVSLATSKLYNISSSGYGSVFQFYGNAYGKYDNTVGVYI